MYDKGCEGYKIRLLSESTVETVILLSQRKADAYVEVNLELSDLDLTSAETKATYEEIKAYIKEKYDLNVSKNVLQCERQ